jgi:hypothetical protein
MMSKQAPSLTEAVQQFIYTYAPQMHYRRELLTLIVEWETAYQARIAELEKSKQTLTPSSSRIPDDDGDNRGNRYGGFID